MQTELITFLPEPGADPQPEHPAAVLGSPGRRVSPGRHYFDCEGTALACFDPMADGDGRPSRPNPEPLYFAVADLAAAWEACRAAGARFPDEAPPGGGPLGRIARRPWGEESLYASDPFDDPLCFVARHTIFTGAPDPAPAEETATLPTPTRRQGER